MKLRVGLTLLAVVLGALVLAGCSDKTSGSTQTLTLTESNNGNFNTFGNVSRGKIPPGSGFTINVPLQDSSKKNVGFLNAACIGTKPTTHNVYGTCIGVADVPDGQLSLTVGGLAGESVSGAISGGTGKYAGATGTFTSSGGKTNTDTFHITLP